MTIKTHYAIAQAGQTDNGKMTSRASVGPATKLYMACEEGSGTSTSDYGGSGLVFDNGDANTTVTWGGAANSCELIYGDGTNGEAAPVAGTIPQPGSDSFLVWHHATPTVLAGSWQFILGVDASASAIKMTASGTWLVRDDAANSIIVPDAPLGEPTVDETFFAAIYVDRSANLLQAYTSSAGATVAADVEDQDASSMTGAVAPGNVIAVNAFADIDTYGFGMYVFSTPPSKAEVLANLETIRQNQLTTSKTLPISWLTTT